MTELQNDLTILGKIWISGYPKFLLDYVPTAIFLHKGEISLACLSAQQQKNPVARSYPVLTVGIGFSFDCIIAVFSALLPLQYPRSFVSSWKLDDILGRLAESNCYRIENIFPSSCCCNFLTDGRGKSGKSDPSLAPFKVSEKTLTFKAEYSSAFGPIPSSFYLFLTFSNTNTIFTANECENRSI